MRSAFDNEIEVASGSDAEEDALCLSFDFSLTLCFNVVERMAVATRSFFVSCFCCVLCLVSCVLFLVARFSFLVSCVLFMASCFDIK